MDKQLIDERLVQPIVRYRLGEQYGDERVRVYDLWHDRELIMSVRQLAVDEKLMAQFFGNEACSIGFIYATLSDIAAANREAAIADTVI